MTLLKHFIRSKTKHKKWVMVSAYDAPTAELLERRGVDIVLVGDSLGMVVLGYDSTLPVTMDEMIHHAKAVRRGARKALVIGDLPLEGVRKGPRQALVSARRFLDEAGCDGVKLEWGPRARSIAEAFRRHRIPFMGHVGLTPQTAGALRVRGREAEKALEIARQAGAFEALDAFSVLLECVPVPLAGIITGTLKVPTIGIGAGPFCDGQVLVFHDLVGMLRRFNPRFVRHYADVLGVMEKAVARYVSDVRSGRFPAAENCFRMDKAEQAKLEKALS